MAIRPESFANRVRQAIIRLTTVALCSDLPTQFDTEAIAIAAVIGNNQDHKRLRGALRDMVRAGELVRVNTGVYALANQDVAAPPEIRQVMWKVIHMRKLVTVEDLMEMSSASRPYAREWLTTLVKHGVMRREGNTYRVIKDSVTMPKLTDNADKIRKCREKKKLALQALDQASQAIAQARAAINDL